jgi:hypothetical protein
MQNSDYINLNEIHRLKDALAGILQSVSLLDQFAVNILQETILRKGLKRGLKELSLSINNELGIKTKFKTTRSFHRNPTHSEELFVYQLLIELIETGIKTYTCTEILFTIGREKQKLYINVKYFYSDFIPVERKSLIAGIKLLEMIKSSEGAIVQLASFSNHTEYLIFCNLA